MTFREARYTFSLNLSENCIFGTVCPYHDTKHSPEERRQHRREKFEIEETKKHLREKRSFLDKLLDKGATDPRFSEETRNQIAKLALERAATLRAIDQVNELRKEIRERTERITSERVFLTRPEERETESTFPEITNFTQEEGNSIGAHVERDAPPPYRRSSEEDTSHNPTPDNSESQEVENFIPPQDDFEYLAFARRYPSLSPN